MPTAPPPHATYDALLAAYRERPGNHTFAANVAGCNYRTARKAWEQGWPKLAWAPPIAGVLAGDVPPFVAPEKPREPSKRPTILKSSRTRRPTFIPPPGPLQPVPEPPPTPALVVSGNRAREQLAQLAETTRGLANGHLGFLGTILQAMAPTIGKDKQVTSRGLLGLIQDELRALTSNPIQAVEWDAEMKPIKYRRYSPRELLALHRQTVSATGEVARIAVLSMALQRTFTGTLIPLLDAQVAAGEMSLEDALRILEQAPQAREQAEALAPSHVVEPKGDER